MFLKRFEILLQKRQQLLLQPTRDELQMRLVNKALYSTFQDCVALGLGPEAKERLQSPAKPSPG